MKMKGDETTLRPFGKALYLGQVTGYRVLSLKGIILFTLASRVFQVVFHLMPLYGAVQLAGVVLYSDDIIGSMRANSPFG